MGIRETSTRAVRAAGATVALAVALSACGGGSGAGVAAEVASRVSALFAPAPRAAVAVTPNLLSNSDFEAGMTDWVSWSNSQVVDGAGASGSLRALRVGTAAGGASHDVAGIVAGTRYRLTSQVKVSDPSEVVYIGINILDQSNSTIAQQAVPVSSTAYSLATVEVAAPANAFKATVFVWKNAGSGFAFVDDVVLTPADGSAAPAPTGANLVSNGGFESALVDWANWGNATAVTGQSSSGANAVRVGTGSGGVAHDVAGIVPGKTYHLSGQVKVSDGSEVAYLGLSFWDTGGSKLLDQTVPVNSTAYSTAQLDLVAPANAAKAMVYIWKNAGSGFAYVDDVALAPTDGTAPTTAPPPAPPPAVDVGVIPIAAWPTTLLQIGLDNDAYWVDDGVWGAWGLTRGSYAGTGGLTYEQYTGASPKIGPNGEVAFRMAWKWPSCCNEIKSFPSIISGRKPGWFNTWTKPNGLDVQLPGGGFSQTFPSGATPGTFFPLQLPIASLKTSFNYQHLSTPSGKGHLAYDMFLQSTPTQVAGFGPNITHEIIIPLDYWGGYGAHPSGRNPAWYDHDVTIDGLLFHVYAAKDWWDGALRPDFGGGWKFIIFEPDRPLAPGTLDLAKFINYITTRRDVLGTPWANGNEYSVSVELGVESQEGVGDIRVLNYRVWR
jgi:hypothetical protein